MKKSNYHKAINKIKVNDTLKNNIIEKMKDEVRKENLGVTKTKKNQRYKIWIPVAATLGIIFLLVWQNQKNNVFNNNVVENNPNNNVVESDPNNNTEVAANLPKLRISNEVGGMGFEGYMAYSIDELENGNPWTIDSDIKILPVFKNKSPLDKLYPLANLSADEMIQKAKEIAALMQININEIYTSPTKEELEAYEKKSGVKQDDTPYEAVALGDGVKIGVGTSGDIRIMFEPGIELPNEFNFTFRDTTREEAKDVLNYLINKYSNVINMKDPTQKLFGHYSFDGEQGFSYDIYESEGDLTNKILNYNFNNVSFAPNEDGDLWIIDIDKKDITEKIGDYPIITVDEARKLLLEGSYITTAPKNFSDEKLIKSVELIYRTGGYDEVFMPYYKFLIELTSMERDNGLKTFGAFYVPAVEGKYIENMPKWEGQFN